MPTYSRLLILVSFVICACGSSSSSADLTNRDPRCLSACPVTMPATDGVGDVCNTASRVQCVDECEVRIAGVTTNCANCLSEGACFGPTGCFGDSIGFSSDGTTCKLTAWNGMCSYPCNDNTMRLACEKQVSPRREVACTTTFKAATQCSSVCN
ncbi:MAG: hypothetical protein JWO36_5190 [Myxococcales bacterium]|nr:hypothetical protein [Myxococcales bacterium]